MFQKLGDALRRFMYGRYGADSLNKWLLIFAVVLMLVGGLGSRYLAPWMAAFGTLAYVPLIWSMFRIYSRNIEARRRENAAFQRVARRFVRRRGQQIHLPKGIFLGIERIHAVEKGFQLPGHLVIVDWRGKHQHVGAAHARKQGVDSVFEDTFAALETGKTARAELQLHIAEIYLFHGMARLPCAARKLLRQKVGIAVFSRRGRHDKYFFAHTLFSFDFRWFYLNITEFPFRQTLVFYTEPFFADMLPVSLLRPQ